jgi:succinyl-diaminopimelate desuccinylase
MTDPVPLLQELIRCQSVTPQEGGALTLLEKLLEKHGFSCHRLTFSEPGLDDVDNLYARWGADAPHFCFAGHTDVVPPGERKDWSFDPFGGEIHGGFVCGRGAADMKGAIACFAAAAIDFLGKNKPKGSISFLITGDEEGPSVNGTKKALEWLQKKGEKIDFCLVGEPTSREKLGDMVKIGRRGSLTGHLTVKGVQGHVAYPHLADNPIPKLVTLLKALDELELDAGTAHFQPSNLELVNIEVRNKAENVIPAEAQGLFNVRFNDTWTGAALEKKLRETLDAEKIAYVLKTRISGESFYTEPGKDTGLVAAAIEAVTGLKPELSTSGGTSDARFIRNYCPVMEFGSLGATMHKHDERIAVKDIAALTDIYTRILKAWFAT